jgi:16S rRNA (uracil1498-N3)-methyltransferase
MRLHRLYCSRLAAGVNELSAEESHHALAVLRLKPGSEVVLFDGAGTEAYGVIQAVRRRLMRVAVASTMNRPFEAACALTLAVAVPKGPRMGLMIEKCTELGVAAFWPMTTARAVVRPSRVTIDKCARRAVEAAKQSGRAWVPAIREPREFADCLAEAGSFGHVCVADPHHNSCTFSDFLAGPFRGGTLLAAVGPEGGWTDDEIVEAVRAGATVVSLGAGILRTETAAMALCAAAAMARSSPR